MAPACREARKALLQLQLVSQKRPGRWGPFQWWIPGTAAAAATRVVSQAVAAGALPAPGAGAPAAGAAAAGAPAAAQQGAAGSQAPRKRSRQSTAAAVAVAEAGHGEGADQQGSKRQKRTQQGEQQQRPGVELVGRRIFVYWDRHRAFYRGVVRSYDAEAG